MPLQIDQRAPDKSSRKDYKRAKDALRASMPTPPHGCAYIPLSQWKYALVDASEAAELDKYNWSFIPLGYAVRISRANGKAQLIYMHSQILGGSDNKHHVDHINWDRLDNRRANLRLVTPGTNAQNKRKADGCSSKYIGVTWFKRGKTWNCGIAANGKRMHLGCFHSEVDAAMAYDRAALKIHGENAMVNFPSRVQESITA